MKLTKYHGLGNDFLIGHFQDLKDYNFSNLAQTLCHRHTGIGADGLIIVKTQPLEMIYYNSDGSKAEMCGNGIRCFAAYCHEKNIIQETAFEVLTRAGRYHLTMIETNPIMVSVDMGQADFDPTAYYAKKTQPLINQTLHLSNETVNSSSLLMGVPHTVIQRDNLTEQSMLNLGKEVSQHHLFSKGTNVNFYHLEDDKHIIMQTYERGAGLTLACGTGACATFALLRHQGIIKQQATVSLPLGDLILEEDTNHHIIMTGPAVKIADILIDERSLNNV